MMYMSDLKFNFFVIDLFEVGGLVKVDVVIVSFSLVVLNLCGYDLYGVM